MKNISTLIGLAALLVITGCASTNEIVSDSTKRTPTTSIDVFKEGRIPDKKFKEVAELSYLGPREDELKAQKFFIRRAESLGGNGIIFSVVLAGSKGGGMFGANGGGFMNSTAWVFKSKVIVYE
jgi:hypothetical protein